MRRCTLRPNRTESQLCFPPFLRMMMMLFSARCSSRSSKKAEGHQQPLHKCFSAKTLLEALQGPMPELVRELDTSHLSFSPGIPIRRSVTTRLTSFICSATTCITTSSAPKPTFIQECVLKLQTSSRSSTGQSWSPTRPHSTCQVDDLLYPARVAPFSHIT